MKCDICKQKIEETFLRKPLGTMFRDGKGKQRWACSGCQRGKSRDELVAALKE